jgi:hypothetical protein
MVGSESAPPGAWRPHPPEPGVVPTLFRFLLVVGVLAGLVYGGMWGLATFVEPQQREMTQPIPASKLGGR